MVQENLILSPISLVALKEEIATLIRHELAVSREAEVAYQLLSPKEACAVFKPAISKTTLVKWTKQGFLTAHRIGGRVFYRHSELVSAIHELKRYKRY